jgi:DNA mismatch repair protein MutL
MTHPDQKIHILPDHLANKIAAGEVIQRPESVVKELLENSLDAGGTRILVRIKDGGKTLIQVVDNGQGMGKDDAVRSFLRHSTSKISSYDDLETIGTYGFRGEALASIASVARVTLKTRREQDDVAVVVEIDADGSPKISYEGREPGTSISVQNLFFKVPARKKFLKSDNTEFRHIYEAVQRVAVSHPQIALTFTSNDETILDLPPSTLQDRLVDVFGERKVESMVWTSELSELLSIEGFIGKPTFGQKGRTLQYLFLNKRYIVSRQINHAIFSAYEHLLTPGTYPFFLLFLTLNPRNVDVNVHPSKMEVKFDDEQGIYRFVAALVRKTLSTQNLVPSLDLSEGEQSRINLRFTDRQHGQRPGGEGFEKGLGQFGGGIGQPGGRRLADDLFRFSERHLMSGHSQPSSDGEGSLLPTSLVWQVHKKYILVQEENGLMIIDQHVAHERILYEQAIHRMNQNASSSQHLLFPHTVDLDAGQFSLYTELESHFHALGFDTKVFGGKTIVIEGVPQDVRAGSENQLLEDLLLVFGADRRSHITHARDSLAKMYSCKAAVKAGEPLTTSEMRGLVDQLFRTEIPYVCPHGRPVVLRISVEELDRRFGRT